jgi:hypothetical protein
MVTPNLSELNRIEEQILLARLSAVRASIVHAGEKGRDLEFHVRRLLRDLLPAEYGLTTGFIAYIEDGSVKLTTQLDIIIYDAVRYSPLVRMESCDVLPLEAVYGYVEVKATIRSSSDEAKELAHNSIEAIVQQNAAIRALRTRVFYNTIAGSPIEIQKNDVHWLAPRAYVVAFEADGATAGAPDKFAKRLAEVLKRQENAHLHGVLVPDLGFYYTRAVDVQSANADEYYHVKYTTDHPLLAFKSILLEGLATFQRPPVEWYPSIDRYLKHKGQWQEQSPND